MIESRTKDSRNADFLYLECASGISGDMAVAALLDLGADEQVLRRALSSLKVTGYEIEIQTVQKAGLKACDFNVKLEQENYDHNMKYLHGGSSEYEHKHEENYGHVHEHAHRGLTEILSILHSGDLTPGAVRIAEQIFQILAEAEAKAHGVPIDQVHFHEVGAVDSIIDIAAVAVCLDNLNIHQVIVSKLWEGYGSIRCQHGVIPVPVAAVTQIAQAYGLPLHITDVEGELVTPTGAAIVAAIRTSDKLPEQFVIQKIGLGAGKRTYAGASGILRAMLLADTGREGQDVIYKLESNIDDCSGETLGYVMERLFEAGARDVNYMPMYMKKNRPAYQLNVICLEEQIPVMEQIMFEETTTIGIRRQKMERTVLEREIQEISTPLGKAKVKFCSCAQWNRGYPEYESAAALAKAHKKPLQEVYQMIIQTWKEENNKGIL